MKSKTILFAVNTASGYDRWVQAVGADRLMLEFPSAGYHLYIAVIWMAWQKTHVAIVTVIANALYTFDCNNYELGRSYSSVQAMVLGIKDGRRTLKLIGISPTPRKLWWFNFPTCILTVFFCLFMRSALAETVMAKHCISARDEMIALQREFDDLIEKRTMILLFPLYIFSTPYQTTKRTSLCGKSDTSVILTNAVIDHYYE